MFIISLLSCSLRYLFLLAKLILLILLRRRCWFFFTLQVFYNSYKNIAFALHRKCYQNLDNSHDITLRNFIDYFPNTGDIIILETFIQSLEFKSLSFFSKSSEIACM